MGHSSGASSLHFTPIRLVHTDRGNRNHTRPCKVRTETPGMPMKKGQPHQETVLSSYIVIYIIQLSGLLQPEFPR